MTSVDSIFFFGLECMMEIKCDGSSDGDLLRRSLRRDLGEAHREQTIFHGGLDVLILYVPGSQHAQ